MKKSLIVLCLLGVVLAGCMPGLRYPKTAEGIIQKAEVSEDPFKKTKWVKFPAIRPNQMSNYKEVTGQSTWNAPVGYFFLRALHSKSPKGFESSLQISVPYSSFISLTISPKIG